MDAVSDILTILHDPVQCQADGMDVRNYGQLSGLPSAKKLFAELLGCRAEECFIGGSASLTLMYDTIAKARACATGQRCCARGCGAGRTGDTEQAPMQPRELRQKLNIFEDGTLKMDDAKEQ